jgi:ABC-type transport system involved in multi-copper enzyme maturation permease subunit
MRNLITIAHLTLHEAVRRRVLTAALVVGTAFLALFGVGMHFMLRELNKSHDLTLIERRVMLNALTLAGLFAASRLIVITAVLLPVDTLSGEIASGVIQTLAAKPVRRSEIVLGKWIGHWLVLLVYFVLIVGGVLVVARALGHFTPPHTDRGLPLLMLEATVLLSVAIAGGTKLSTITNGMTAFGLYGFAFIGNWIEQIGTFADNVAARNVGTVSSLVMPSESLWNLAAYQMQPTIMRELTATPFSPVAVPSVAIVWWSVGYIVVVLWLGLRVFRRRAL